MGWVRNIYDAPPVTWVRGACSAVRNYSFRSHSITAPGVKDDKPVANAAKGKPVVKKKRDHRYPGIISEINDGEVVFDLERPFGYRLRGDSYNLVRLGVKASSIVGKGGSPVEVGYRMSFGGRTLLGHVSAEHDSLFDKRYSVLLDGPESAKPTDEGGDLSDLIEKQAGTSSGGDDLTSEQLEQFADSVKGETPSDEEGMP